MSKSTLIAKTMRRAGAGAAVTAALLAGSVPVASAHQGATDRPGHLPGVQSGSGHHHHHHLGRPGRGDRPGHAGHPGAPG
jgi:hypothetical protein